VLPKELYQTGTEQNIKPKQNETVTAIRKTKKKKTKFRAFCVNRNEKIYPGLRSRL